MDSNTLLEQKFLKTGSLNREALYRYFVHKKPFTKNGTDGLFAWPDYLIKHNLPHFLLCGAILDRALVDLLSGKPSLVNSVLDWDYDDFCEVVTGRELDPKTILKYFKHVYQKFVLEKP